MIELAWKWNDRLSGLNLVFAASSCPTIVRLNDPTRLDAMTRLSGLAKRLDLTQERFWELIFQLVIDCSGARDLAERLSVRSLPATARTTHLLEDLTAAIQIAMAAAEAEQPNFQREIQLRMLPIREQWEAFGPGLWHQLAQWLDPTLFVEKAQVYLVLPARGGFGWAHLSTNRCHIEAVLANSHPQLTEVLRLCWLLSQLDFERPQYSEMINARRLRRVAGLAMLPPVLSAAEELGLCRFDSALLLTALETWAQESPGNATTALAEVLAVWWETLRAGQSEWSVALAGLDRMLA